MADKDVAGHARCAAPVTARIICTTARHAAGRIGAAARRHRGVGQHAHGRSKSKSDPAARAGARRHAFTTCRRGGLDLFDRSPAWYSSLIPAAAGVRACFASALILTLCVLSDWALVPAARARPDNISRLQTDRMRDSAGLHQARRQPLTLTGTAGARRPDRLRRHAVLRRQSGALPGRRTVHRDRGTCVFVSGNSRISAERLEFNTKTKTGTFYNASGTHGDPRQGPARLSSARRSRTRSSGERNCKARAEEVPDRAAAASRPACSRRRAGRSPPARSR